MAATLAWNSAIGSTCKQVTASWPNGHHARLASTAHKTSPGQAQEPPARCARCARNEWLSPLRERERVRVAHLLAEPPDPHRAVRRRGHDQRGPFPPRPDSACAARTSAHSSASPHPCTALAALLPAVQANGAPPLRVRPAPPPSSRRLLPAQAVATHRLRRPAEKATPPPPARPPLRRLRAPRRPATARARRALPPAARARRRPGGSTTACRTRWPPRTRSWTAQSTAPSRRRPRGGRPGTATPGRRRQARACTRCTPQQQQL